MKQSSRTNIHDPYGETPVRQRMNITCYIDPEVHRYFQRSVFGGTPGAMTATVANLLNALHQELIKEKITQWNPDNEQRVIDILKRTNFRDGVPTPAKRTAPRRTNPPTPLPPPQPTGGEHVPAAAH